MRKKSKQNGDFELKTVMYVLSIQFVILKLTITNNVRRKHAPTKNNEMYHYRAHLEEKRLTFGIIGHWTTRIHGNDQKKKNL